MKVNPDLRYNRIMNRNHNNTDFVYRNSRPSLAIVNAGGASLGRCYSASYFDVTSTRPLSMEDFDRLRECGFLGYGQEFMAHQVIGEEKVRVPQRFNRGRYVVGFQEGDDKFPTVRDIKASGVDVVPCVMVDRHTGEVVPGKAINPYSGEEYGPNNQDYFVYRCESRCDSSD